MTRINVVPPNELSGKHLAGEHHELPRVFSLVRRAQERGERPDKNAIPTYRLGEGHVRFFYPRLMWVWHRYSILRYEMTKRGYQINPEPLPLRDGINPEWFGVWRVTPEALEINRARLKERSGDDETTK